MWLRVGFFLSMLKKFVEVKLIFIGCVWLLSGRLNGIVMK